MNLSISSTSGGIPLNTSTHPLILTRLYHRWIPRLAEEPTSTLLLITPLNRFLELRFLCATVPILYHGTAGTYIRTSTSGLRGYTISTSSDGTENHYHTLHHQLNGDIMESGALVDPSDHVLKSYEAVWRVSEPVPRVCVVLVLKEGKGMVVRVGGWCQGLMKIAGELTAERWAKGKGGKWERIVRVGSGVLPCMVACMDRDDSGAARGGRYWREARGLGFVVEKTVGEGDGVVIAGAEWAVVEKCHW